MPVSSTASIRNWSRLRDLIDRPLYIGTGPRTDHYHKDALRHRPDALVRIVFFACRKRYPNNIVSRLPKERAKIAHHAHYCKTIAVDLHTRSDRVLAAGE